MVLQIVPAIFGVGATEVAVEPNIQSGNICKDLVSHINAIPQKIFTKSFDVVQAVLMSLLLIGIELAVDNPKKFEASKTITAEPSLVQRINHQSLID